MSIVAENLSCSYGFRPVLRHVSFSLEKGKILSVLGPNGVGKSTLFRCLLGNFPYEGSVLIDGEELRGLSPGKRAKKIAYIPQNHRPTFGYTVLDTALMGTTRQISPFLSPGKAQVAQAREALRRVGMEDRAHHRPSEMSGGQQQRVAIARAIATKPPIIMADEPTGALDSKTGLHVLGILRDLCRNGTTILLITHDEGIASTAPRVVRLADGKIIADYQQEVNWT